MKFSELMLAAVLGIAIVAGGAGVTLLSPNSAKAETAVSFDENKCVAVSTAEGTFASPAKSCACLAAAAAQDKALDADLAKLQTLTKEERGAYSTAVTAAIKSCS